MEDASPQPNVGADATRSHSAKFWGLLCLCGGLAGISGGLLMRLLRLVQHLAYSYSSGDFLSGVGHVPPIRRVEMLFAAGLIAAVFQYLRQRYSRLKLSGLNRAIWERSGKLPLLSTVVEGLQSIVTVGLGMPLGREGALKDIGGALASKVSDVFEVTDAERKLLVASAAGAGMGAAYNIPLGGSLFAAEVLIGWLSLATALPALAAGMIATAVSWILLPNKPSYFVPAYAFQTQDIGWAVIAGPIFGVASILWVRGIAWAGSLEGKDWHRVAMPIVAFTAVGVVALWFPDILGNGKGLVQRSYLDWFSLQQLGSLLVLRFLATVLCLGAGGPGGLFTPTMACGSLLGSILGRLWGMLIPSPTAGVFAEIGSATLLAVATQGPISSIVMVMELTHHIDTIMVPLMVAIVGASLVAYRFEKRSIYTARP